MKRMSPKAFYYTIGKKNFFQYILFGIFILFFYMPLMNLCMLAFADKYEDSPHQNLLFSPRKLTFVPIQK